MIRIKKEKKQPNVLDDVRIGNPVFTRLFLLFVTKVPFELVLLC